MVKYFCDRCGQKLDREARNAAKDIKVNNQTRMSLVCEGCLASLQRWMEQKPSDTKQEDKEPNQLAEMIKDQLIREYREMRERGET